MVTNVLVAVSRGCDAFLIVYVVEQVEGQWKELYKYAFTTSIEHCADSYSNSRSSFLS